MRARPSAGTTSTGSWALAIKDGELTWYVSKAGSDSNPVTGPTKPALNTWVHVAGVFDSTTQTARAFVNGTPGTETALGVTKLYQPTGIPLTMGNYDYPTSTDLEAPFAGYVDEVRVSNNVRYSAAFTPASGFAIDANTLALYHCDEASGTTAADVVSTTQAATLSQNAVFSTATVCH